MKNNTRKSYETFTASLQFSNELADKVYSEILDILTRTPFKNLRVPLYSYASYFDDTVSVDDQKAIQIGFVKGFDANNDSEEFTVTIYNKRVDTVKLYSNLAVIPEYTLNKAGNLSEITRFMLLPVAAEDEPTTEEVQEEVAE